VMPEVDEHGPFLSLARNGVTISSDKEKTRQFGRSPRKERVSGCRSIQTVYGLFSETDVAFTRKRLRF
jgi:hypothetical protein